MDKNSTLIGMLLLIAGVGLMMWQSQQMQERQRQTPPPALREEMTASETPGSGSEPNAPGNLPPASDNPELQPARDSLFRPIEEAARKLTETAAPEVAEELFVLENEFIRVEFTNLGGAVRSVALKKYPAVQGQEAPYVFNENGQLPALAISRDQPGGRLQAYAPAYRMTRLESQAIEFTREETDGIVILRRYELSAETVGPAPYTIQHTTRLINQSTTTFAVESLYFNLGTAAPDIADKMGMSLNAGWFDGQNFETESISTFTGGGFLFFSSEPKPFVAAEANVVWASVKNQFFASILTPSEPAHGVFLEDVDFPPDPITRAVPKGITGSMRVNFAALPAGSEKALDMAYYVGPKEYDRLSKIGHSQDKVMQFGWGIIGFIGKFLYTLLNLVQGAVINWGLAIMLVTVFLRLLMWPLTAKAAESSRAMQKIAEPMKELREKYKDNPTKLNQEMLKMWKKHKVNPLAGCIPILIQIPIFIAFFYMLRSASELRFAHFLWVPDLSLPDTVANIGGFPLNILPLIMGVSMFFQMKLTPTPSIDNTQAMIMKFMPAVFLIFCYNFSSGLVLYWTTSNCMSILQQIYTNRKREREEQAEKLAGGTPKTPAPALQGNPAQSQRGQQDPSSANRRANVNHSGRAKVHKKKPGN